MTRCQYGTCQEEVAVSVLALRPPEMFMGVVLLCDSHIADWAIHWRDGHSEPVETL